MLKPNIYLESYNGAKVTQEHYNLGRIDSIFRQVFIITFTLCIIWTIFIIAINIVLLLELNKAQITIFYSLISPIFGISIATVILLSSVIGFYSLKKQNYAISIVYLILLVIISSLTLVEVISVLVLASNTQELESEIIKNYEKYFKANTSFSQQAFFYQNNFNCCGLNSKMEWYNYTLDHLAPNSCCLNKNTSCFLPLFGEEMRLEVWSTNCKTILREKIQFSAQSSSYALIPIIVLLLVLIISSLVQTCILKKEKIIYE